MYEVIGKGKTLEDATEDALRQLGATREEVEIDPLTAGTKGFLGIGSKPAQVKATLRDGEKGQVKTFVSRLMELIGIDTKQEIKEEGDEVFIHLGEEASPLIGHHGQTLDAMQYLISRILNGEKEDWKKVVLDIDNYRERRDENLKEMALSMAQKVVETKKDQKTQPLSGGERRIVHMTLKENEGVTTFSIGSGDKKRIVIALNDRENGRPSGSDDRKRGGRGGRGGGKGRGGGGNRNSGGNRSGGNRGGRGRGNRSKPEATKSNN